KSKKTKGDTLDRLVLVKPDELKKNIKSLIVLKKLPYNEISLNFSKELYEFLGYFVGDGSFNTNRNSNKKNYYLYIAGGIDSKEIINKLIIPLQKKGFIKNYWLKKKGDICINGLKIIKIAEKFRINEKNKNIKIISEFILNERRENIASFLRGLFSADGTIILRKNKPIIRFTNTSKEIILKTSLLLHKIGISHSIFKENSPNKYKNKISNTYSYHINIKSKKEFSNIVSFLINRKNQRLKFISKDSKQKRSLKKYGFDLSRVLKVEEINYNDYVYDLEVEKHHRFFANNILVHNTDSIFIETKSHSLEDAQKIGKEISFYVNEFWKEHVKNVYGVDSYLELQFEKTFIRFIMPKIRGTEIGAKKRYAGLLLQEGQEKIDFRGLEFVRRDWTDLSKKFQLELLDLIFHKKEVIDYIKKFVNDLKKGKYDSLLIYKKAIRKDLENYTKTTPPHVKAARKLDKITSNIISYVMTKDGPEPIQKITHSIDYEHYIEKQIKPIADSILTFYNTNFDKIINDSKQTSLFGFQ
ncbi:MAG: DNA polymerase domain-containing protein, partial [Candidatus Woesearchaeota archaeon]